MNEIMNYENYMENGFEANIWVCTKMEQTQNHNSKVPVPSDHVEIESLGLLIKDYQCFF